MTLQLGVPALVSLVGALCFGLGNGKVAQMGFGAFQCGLLAFLLINKF